MTRRNAVSAAAVMAAALFFGAPALPAFAQHLPHSRAHRDLTPALQKSLSDKVSDEAAPYLDKEDEKKQQGKIYTDLQQKFEYLPNYGTRGQLVVSVKLGGAEYNPAKSGSSKGASTGTLRYLVFTYSLEKGKWVEVAKPKWESQKLGEQAAAQMTSNIARGDKLKAQREAAKTKAAAAAAAAAAQKAADRSAH
jgi:hypothetical protein